MPKTMEQLTAGETGKVLQGFRNLILNFKNNGREIGAGMEEFLEYMTGLNLQVRQHDQEIAAAQAAYAKLAKPCPHCNTPMYCYTVNSCPSCMVGGSWQSQWICPKPECEWAEYSPLEPSKEWEHVTATIDTGIDTEASWLKRAWRKIAARIVTDDSGSAAATDAAASDNAKE